jgi:hypothetical protein
MRPASTLAAAQRSAVESEELIIERESPRGLQSARLGEGIQVGRFGARLNLRSILDNPDE